MTRNCGKFHSRLQSKPNKTWSSWKLVCWWNFIGPALFTTQPCQYPSCGDISCVLSACHQCTPSNSQFFVFSTISTATMGTSDTANEQGRRTHGVSCDLDCGWKWATSLGFFVEVSWCFFSTKKNQHSINVLMVISLSGRILYLSPSYPGSYEDLTLSKVTKEEWRSLWRMSGD